ncbi:MAG: electron transfer flavoprotein subunit beta/FixA family protein [Dehalococcoidales bacterium]
MNIIVCVKQVPDPETPPKGFQVDQVAKRVIPPLGAALVINPFDENAVEAALRFKDAYGGNVTALTMGPPSAEDVLRHAMAMGVDEGVLIENPAPDNLDSFATAYCLAGAIKKMGTVDLIVCGREAADWNAGQVGPGIAELLKLPSVTLVKNIALVDKGLTVERVIPDGFEVVELTLPALLTVTNELGNPRYPTVRGVMEAKKKEITLLRLPDLGIDELELSNMSQRLQLRDLFIPVYERKCHLFKANTLEEAAISMAHKLIELKPS